MNKIFILSLCSLVMMFSSSHAAVDPTRPPGERSYTQSSGTGAKKLNLQGLVVGEKSWVVINDVVLQQGQSKNGIRVIKIEKSRVLVRNNGNRVWLEWQSEIVKKHLNAESIK